MIVFTVDKSKRQVIILKNTEKSSCYFGNRMHMSIDSEAFYTPVAGTNGNLTAFIELQTEFVGAIEKFYGDIDIFIEKARGFKGHACVKFIEDIERVVLQ